MTSRELARDLHELWERAQFLHLEARELLGRVPADDPYRRLALEIALHDLVGLAARAAALADLAEAAAAKSKRRKA
jgi:hypothetical protein